MSDNYAVLTSNGTTTAVFRSTDVGGGIQGAMSIPMNTSGTAMIGQALMASSLPVAIASNQSNVPFNIAAVGGTTFGLGQAIMATSIPVAIASNQSNVPFNLAAVGGTTFSLGQKVSATSISMVPASDAVWTTVISTTVPTILRVAATAGTPAVTAVKASAGTLKCVNLVSNNTAASIFLKLYNFTAGAVNSSIAPLFTVGVPPGSSRDVSLGDGGAFTTAISFWITGLAADNDTTAVAINDLQGILTFI